MARRPSQTVVCRLPVALSHAPVVARSLPSTGLQARACTRRPAMTRSGAISASGTRTKARSNRRGCGSVRPASRERDIVVGDQVEVEGARAPARLAGPVATMFRLDRVQHAQQRMGIEAGLDLDAGVDEARLFGIAPGRRRVVGGSRPQGRVRELAEVRDGLLERRADIADIAAQRNECATDHEMAAAASGSAPRRRRRRSRRSARAACARRP